MICLVLDSMNAVTPKVLGSNNNIIVTNLDSNFFYVPIPKNASSSTYIFLQQYDWAYYQYDNKEQLRGKTAFAVLREPIDRWCSGFAQDFNKSNVDLDSSTSMDKLFNENLNFGIHTKLQSFFLETIGLNSIIYIKHDGTYSNNLENFVVKIMKMRVYKKVGNGKSVMDYSVKDKIKNILYTNPKYLTLLKKYLEKDLDLYNSANFYIG